MRWEDGTEERIGGKTKRCEKILRDQPSIEELFNTELRNHIHTVSPSFVSLHKPAQKLLTVHESQNLNVLENNLSNECNVICCRTYF